MAEDLIREFTTEQLLKIKEIIIDSINTLLPKILIEVTPLIIQTSKNIVDKEWSKQTLNTCSNVKQVNTSDEFYQQHHLQWNKLLNHRENLYYKHERSDQLLELYNNCLAEEPIYIPRKFRNDKYHVNTKEEKHIVMKSNIQKLQNECEILKLRRDNFASEIIKQDEKINLFITDVTTSTTLTNELKTLHNEEIQRDMDRINSQRKKKFNSTKESFQRDKTKYFQLYHDILSLQQNDPPKNYDENERKVNNKIVNSSSSPTKHTNNSPSKNEIHRYPIRKKINQQS